MAFLCAAIRKYIQSTPLDVYDYHGKYRQLNYTIRLYFPPNAVTNANPKFVADYIAAVIEWIASFRCSSTHVEKLSIDLWWTPFRKVWRPLEQPEVGMCEVNSGETAFIGKRERRIRIWRQEDWHKVVLHELLHAFDFDRLCGNTHPERWLHESETLVEVVALILHCQLLGGPGAGWRQILQLERNWMAQQVAILLRTKWSAPDTAVFSYYVLKAALVIDDYALSQFMTYLRGENHSNAEWRRMTAHLLQRLQGSVEPVPAAIPAAISMKMVLYELSGNARSRSS
jgi:hypothetical protein